MFGKTETLSGVNINMEGEPKSVVIDIPEILVTSPFSELPKVCSKSSVAVFGKTETPSDISIDIKDEPKSVLIIDIPDILVTSSLSECESQSESSADESSSDEGEYILP